MRSSSQSSIARREPSVCGTSQYCGSRRRARPSRRLLRPRRRLSQWMSSRPATKISPAAPSAVRAPVHDRLNLRSRGGRPPAPARALALAAASQPLAARTSLTRSSGPRHAFGVGHPPRVEACQTHVTGGAPLGQDGHELDGRPHHRRLSPVRVSGREAGAAPAGGRAGQLHHPVAVPSPPRAGRPAIRGRPGRLLSARRAAFAPTPASAPRAARSRRRSSPPWTGEPIRQSSAGEPLQQAAHPLGVRDSHTEVQGRRHGNDWHSGQVRSKSLASVNAEIPRYPAQPSHAKPT